MWLSNHLDFSFIHSKIAPASVERQQELVEEEETVAAMKTYKRKIYITQKRMVSQCIYLINLQ